MIRSISLQRVQLRPLVTRLAPRGNSAPSCCPRYPVVARAVCREQFIRRASSAPPPATKPRGPKFEIPQRMIVYHMGTPRIMFLGALKLTTIFLFGFFAVVIIPPFASADVPLWKPIGLAVIGSTPFLLIWYLTSPMAVWIHMRLPDRYRRSKHVADMFLNDPPADAEVAITNMGAMLKPRVSHVKVSDLKPARKRFGLVNYTRDTTGENAQRKWWMFRAVGNFRIEDETTGSKSKWAWDSLARRIRQRAVEEKTRRS
ncbi:hypothetical protein KVR01_010265 [Diaporthe batatas]|uniref:uncharacterized protein n=1 Tax=Diaporthe batatas TaxID=748121 RepID=UPI001D03B17D|nr:uncharacterized protein KVR01_010265 [Diaporthe batatas]KAG8159628.1 hypothetical protein KVR01_010265 [Diaporthe batatas]